MKIGLYNECFPPILDGVSTVMQNYARLLTDRGNHVTVLTAKVPFANYNYPYDVINVPSVPMLFRPPYRIGFPESIIPPFAPAKRFLPDIAHAHSPFSAGKIARRIAKRHHIPFVATFHSKFRQDFEENSLPKFVIDQEMKSIMGVYAAADEVWIPQLAVLDTMREYGYKGKVEVVPNAIDYEVDLATVPQKKAAARQLFGIGNELCLLFVGQLIWPKNIRFIVEALETLPVPFRMFFVGKGYAHDELVQLVREKNLQDRVKIVPQVNKRIELENFYFASDLFLFPSLYDNAPLVVREAAAHCTPALLIDGSTSAEVITDHQNGFLVRNDINDFAARILELDKNRSLIDSVGRRAAQTLGLKWREIMPEIEDRYRSLIKRKQK